MDLGSGQKPNSLVDSPVQTSVLASALTSDSVSGQAGFDIGAIDKFPGPALVLSANGWLIYGNIHAEPFILALKEADGSVTTLIERCLVSDAPLLQKITLSVKSGSRYLDVYVIPVSLDDALQAIGGNDEKRGVMIFARETTLEQNLTNALVESRQMFKDLLTCSADFAWETDTHGIFRYVSPRGAFGYPAHELTGRRAEDFLAEPGQATPFTNIERSETPALAIKRNDGTTALVHAAGTPILNQKGEWLGARGICRDISGSVTQARNHDRLQARHSLIMRLVTLSRAIANHTQILTESAATIADAIHGDCWILRRNGDEFVIDGSAGLENDIDLEQEIVATMRGIMSLHRVPNGGTLNETIGDRHVTILPTVHHGVVNGAVVAFRDNSAEFEDHIIAMLDEAAEFLSVTIEQARNRAAIEALTITDELTGLMNRRSFMDFVERRVAHQRRTGYPANFLLVKLDNFEGIEESLGHPFGDAALREFGDMLKRESRAGDAVARLDGDLFALWLEDTPLEGAIHKARHIIRDCDDIILGRVSGTGTLSASVGIAPCEDIKHGNLKQLIETARDALDAARLLGDGQWAVAPTDQTDNLQSTSVSL